MKDTRSADVRFAHDLVDEFQKFANSQPCGHCKNWKATSMLVQIFESPDQFTGRDLQLFVCNCLEMEGFRTEDCLVIAAWLQEKVDSFVDSQTKVA